MTTQNQIWKCEVCGNIIEILHEGAGALVCCDKPMVLQTEKTKDEGTEKHLPVFEKTEKEVIVKVGEVPHPMEPEHFIEWIELIKEANTIKKFLKPGQEPQVEFCTLDNVLQIRAYCNVHGLWQNEIN